MWREGNKNTHQYTDPSLALPNFSFRKLEILTPFFISSLMYHTASFCCNTDNFYQSNVCKMLERTCWYFIDQITQLAETWEIDNLFHKRNTSDRTSQSALSINKRDTGSSSLNVSTSLLHQQNKLRWWKNKNQQGNTHSIIYNTTMRTQDFVWTGWFLQQPETKIVKTWASLFCLN